MATATALISVAVQAGIPAIAWGKPGGGKTKTFQALAVILDRWLETVIAATRDPTDFSGLPWIHEGSVRLAAPRYARALIEAHERGQAGMLFFDELSTAPPAVQAALLRVLNEGWVGETKLPDTTAMVAAANDVAQAAGGFLLAPPTANRLAHFEWRVDPALWSEGMTAGWGSPDVILLPDGWRETFVPASKSLVGSYIHHLPTALEEEPADEIAAGKAWASPRTWEMAAILHGAAVAAGQPERTQLQLMAACIGEASTVKFLNWSRALDLPDPYELLKDPSKLQLPARGDVAHAILSSVLTAATAEGRLTPERWKACWAVFTRGLKQRHADIVAVSAKGLLSHRGSIPGLGLPESIADFLPLLGAAGQLGNTAPASAGRRR